MGGKSCGRNVKFSTFNCNEIPITLCTLIFEQVLEGTACLCGWYPNIICARYVHSFYKLLFLCNLIGLKLR
jgi:hypothetical protein